MNKALKYINILCLIIFVIRYKLRDYFYIRHGAHEACVILGTTDVHRLTRGILSEKCVVRRFRRCANVIECTYTNLDSIAHYTPRLYSIAYCS